MTATSPPSRALRIGFLSVWASRRGGGVYEALRNHVLALRDEPGLTPLVFALQDDLTAEDQPSWGDVPVVTRPGYGPLGYAPGLLGNLLAADLDILHLHGIWMYPSACAAAWAARTGRPMVVSPHGMLEPWIISRGRWKKAIARAAYENRNWRAARAFHALTAAEAGDIAASLATVKAGAEIITLPNGVVADAPRSRMPDGPASVLYIGRIHPKKNLEALVAAWARVRPAGPRRLTIAGWGDPAHVAALQARIAEAADPSITFLGPVYGAAKTALLAEARFLVLPSFSEGLPMTVLEAWAVGTPVVMTAACNLPAGFARGAAIETEPSAEGIATSLRLCLPLAGSRWGARQRQQQRRQPSRMTIVNAATAKSMRSKRLSNYVK